MLQSFRIAYVSRWIFPSIVNKKVDPFENLPVFLLLIEIVFPNSETESNNHCS